MLKEKINYFKELTTPFYYYDLELLDRTLDALEQSLPSEAYRVHYAIKANSDAEILRHIAAKGFGADCVSGGEILTALEYGIKPENIVYAGVGKTDDEIRLALNAGIGSFNVESIEELCVINDIAQKTGSEARVALRINPDIDAHTHEYITTGLKENKFGIQMSQIETLFDHLPKLKNIKLIGLHFHIGSQITITEPFKILCERINRLIPLFEERGYEIRTINLGGGIGVDYDTPDENPIPDFKSFLECIDANLHLRSDQQVHIEPGRSIVAQCGSLISRVLYVKKGEEKDFVIIDAGMTDLIRPALYGAHHKIDNLSSDSTDTAVYNIVGPICESSDCFATAENMPVTQRGDIIAIRSAGAYGQVMASTYNGRRLPRSVY